MFAVKTSGTPMEDSMGVPLVLILLNTKPLHIDGLTGVD